MTDLMGNERGALPDTPGVGAANRPRSLVVHTARVLQGRVALRQPSKLKIEMLDGRFDQFHWVGRIRASRHDICVQLAGGFADWIESVHPTGSGQRPSR